MALPVQRPALVRYLIDSVLFPFLLIVVVVYQRILSSFRFDRFGISLRFDHDCPDGSFVLDLAMFALLAHECQDQTHLLLETAQLR
jgi:hypothetical protein